MATPMSAVSLAIGLGAALLSGVHDARTDRVVENDALASIGIISDAVNETSKADPGSALERWERTLNDSSPGAGSTSASASAASASASASASAGSHQQAKTKIPWTDADRLAKSASVVKIPGKLLEFKEVPATRGGGARSTGRVAGLRPIGALMRALKRRYIGSRSSKRTT